MVYVGFLLCIIPSLVLPSDNKKNRAGWIWSSSVFLVGHWEQGWPRGEIHRKEYYTFMYPSFSIPWHSYIPHSIVIQSRVFIFTNHLKFFWCCSNVRESQTYPFCWHGIPIVDDDTTLVSIIQVRKGKLICSVATKASLPWLANTS